MKKILKSKGITLIALVITIIVMLILASLTINVAFNGGLFQYSKQSTSKYKEAEQSELQTVEEWMELIDKSINQGYKTAWEGNQTGENGQIILPISLNDCSKMYRIQMESEKYTGQAILNVYSMQEGIYVGRISVDNSNAYIWQLRNIMQNTTNSDGVSNIDYQGNKYTNTDSSILTYNTEDFGSDVVITKIGEKQKEYSLFA